MPLPQNHLLKVVFGGNVAGEDWSCGVWFRPPDTSAIPTVTLMNTFLGHCVTSIGGFWSGGLKAVNAAGTTLTFVKGYWYFNTVLQLTGVSAISASVGSGSNPLPSYVARVLSLYSDTPGRFARGRVYLPYTGLAVSSSTFQWATASTVESAFKTMTKQMESDAVTDFSLPGNAPLSVVSRTNAGPYTVTQLRMDSIPDTQHGRTRKLTPIVIDQLAY